MTPYHYYLPDDWLIESYLPARRDAIRVITVLNENWRHAFRACKLKYNKNQHSIVIRNASDESNLALFKLTYL